MGAFLDKPKTEKHNEHGCGNGLRYGVASMQGWRVEMEDAHCAVTGLSEELPDWSFFAVFDGHAGARVSAHCADHLLESIVQSEEFKRGDDIIKGIRSGFLHLDDRMRELPELASGEDKSGSTAVCALISPRQVFVANCGDSRALLCRDGKPVFATCDHKPVLPAEKERIIRAGGSVMIQRVNGSLAVSRALGDYEYKNVEGRGPCEQLVSPEPEVSVMDWDEDRDEFLVLACDGVWDVMTNEDLCSFVRSRLAISNDLESIANQVIDTCLYKGSRDNMSIVLVTFPGVGQPSSEAIQREMELEATLERRITELVRQSDNLEFLHVLQALAEDDIPGLPPGGGLSAKRNFIESVFKKLCPQQADSCCASNEDCSMCTAVPSLPLAYKFTHHSRVVQLSSVLTPQLLAGLAHPIGQSSPVHTIAAWAGKMKVQLSKAHNWPACLPELSRVKPNLTSSIWL